MLNGQTKATVKRLTNYFWSAGITNPIDLKDLERLI